MDRFENIFGNIKCNVTRRRAKTSKSVTQTCYKNKLQLFPGRKNLQKNASTINNEFDSDPHTTTLNSSFFFNTKSKNKYYTPTRYNTLEIVRVKNTSKGHNRSTQIFPLKESSENGFSSICCENETLENKTSPFNISESNRCDNISKVLEKNHIKCSFNSQCCNSNKRKYFQTSSFLQNKSNDTGIPKNDNSLCEENPSSVNSVTENDINKSTKLESICLEPSQIIDSPSTTQYTSLEPSQIIETPSTSQESECNVASELDLLIDLIQREEKAKSSKVKYQKQNDDDDLTLKSCLKGGYEELFVRSLKNEKCKNNFLKHDKKFGLKIGTLLTIENIHTSYGLTVAIVKCVDLDKHFGVVVAQEVVPQIKVGAEIEAFFDEKSLPYTLKFGEEYLDVYLEPYKLLVP